LHEALVIGEKASRSATAAAHRELAYVEFLRGRYERALAWLRRATPFAMDDRAEQASIATLHGSVLSDTAHYRAAVEMLRSAEDLLEGAGDRSRGLAYALSMRGRAQMLSGELDAAADALDRSVALAHGQWTAFLPWPLSLRAEVDLERGNVAGAAESFEHAFALGCQLGDPCWEGIAARGLGRVAIARGDVPRAIEILRDAVSRCVRLPDGYLWGKAYALDALCTVGVANHLPQTPAWVDELMDLAARTGMRELTARAHGHRARLGDRSSEVAARMLAEKIDNPVLQPSAPPG
jgi:tetratricopeptide (TPR) repeat protein